MRILLADDHEIVREGLCACLETKPSCEVVGQAEDGNSVVQLAETLRPDVVVMDVSMPGISGIEAARRIVAQSNGEVKVVVLSMHASREFILEAFRVGASAYLLKCSAFRELLEALQHVAKGKTYLSPAIAHLVIDQLVRGGTEKEPASDEQLTSREMQIIQLLADGYSAKQIGRQLDLSHKTIHAVRAQVMAKIHARTMVDLIKYALRHQLTCLK
jgi:DNA-binding NarL/FixJ family response regulator